MKLSYQEQNNFLENFPNIELSYEKRMHKKIHSTDFCITIPKGLKYFAWFRTYKGQMVCSFLQLFKKRRISEISIKRCCFHSNLCIGKGSILYGTIFTINKKQFFNIEDIFFFKDRNVSNYIQKKKLEILSTIFKKYIRQVTFTGSDIVFGLPIFSTTYEDMLKKINKLPYTLYCIQHRFLNKKSCFFNQMVEFKKNAVFLVKARIEPDIYELYHKTGEELEFFDIAYIRDYKTSVFMNSLFRNIKENRNLDSLEESDDEEEFENIREDKYVYLEKSFKITCVYNNRFKKWVPFKVVPEYSGTF